jgi:hypothetical protein
MDWPEIEETERINKMTNLNEIFGLNQYCGPSVLSALTGRSTDSCAAVISAVSGRNTIKAVQVTHLLQACERLGFTTEQVKSPAGTVFGLLSSLHGRPGFYIIVVPHHVIAVEVSDKIYLIDNTTKRAINAANSARLTQRIENVWQVKPKPKPTAEEINRDRISWLRSKIDNLNCLISQAVRDRELHIKELENLQNERSECKQ